MESKTIKRLRPFTLADAQEVTHLFNICSRATSGNDEFELESMINDWKTPGFDVEKTVRVLENEQGQIIGYIEVWDSSKPHVNKSVYGLLHPDHWDDDQFRTLLSWAETCARERISLAPDGSGSYDALRRTMICNVKNIGSLWVQPGQTFLPDGN